MSKMKDIDTAVEEAMLNPELALRCAYAKIVELEGLISQVEDFHPCLVKSLREGIDNE